MKSITLMRSVIKFTGAFLALTVLGSGTAMSCYNSGGTWTPTTPSTVSADLGCGQTGISAFSVSNSSASSTFGQFAVDINNHGSGATAYSSYGVVSSSGDTDSIDSYGRTDLLLLSFSESQELDQIKLQTTANKDWDFSVFAWADQGSIPTTSSIAGKTISQLKSAWTLVGNYSQASSTTAVETWVEINDGLASDADPKNDSPISSSWWIVSAYTQRYGDYTVGASGCTSGDCYPDYIRVLAVACEPTNSPNSQTPEPGSLALAGLAMIGLFASRRRKQ